MFLKWFPGTKLHPSTHFTAPKCHDRVQIIVPILQMKKAVWSVLGGVRCFAQSPRCLESPAGFDPEPLLTAKSKRQAVQGLFGKGLMSSGLKYSAPIPSLCGQERGKGSGEMWYNDCDEGPLAIDYFCLSVCLPETLCLLHLQSQHAP